MANELRKQFAKTFKKQLRTITDAKIRSFVLDTFEKLGDEEFFVKPASSTGKNHPRNCCKDGGLVLHTKTAVWWLEQILESSPALDELKNHAIASLLLHDIHKNEENHGSYTAQKIFETTKDTSNPDFAMIQLGVACHMGRWGKPRPSDLANLTQRMFCNMVHLADYCASRHFDELAGVSRPALPPLTMADLKDEK